MTLARLAEGLGADVVVTSEAERRSRALDLWPQALGWGPEEAARRVPPAVLLPRSEEEAAACLAWAREEGARLVIRGAGSGVVGAAIPEPGALVLDSSRLLGRAEVLEGAEPAVRVSCGWRGGELERNLNARGWSLRHFPQSMEESSIGGWIAHDGFGQLSTRYGGVRAQVRSLRVAGLDGAVRQGDAREQLGAEGTLGLITEATLLARRLPRARRFFTWSLGGVEEAAGFARVLAAASPPPSVLRALGPVDRLVHSFGHGSGGGSRLQALLLGRTSWLRALAPLAGRRWTLLAVYEDEAPFGSAPPPAVALLAAAGEAPARGWWERRFKPDGSRLKAVFAQGCFADTADLWAPYSRLAELEREAVRAAFPHAFAFAHLSHFDAEGACVYVTLAGAGGAAKHRAAWAAVLDACVRAGGRVNHHHGIGRAKAAWSAHAGPAGRGDALALARSVADPGGLLGLRG